MKMQSQQATTALRGMLFLNERPMNRLNEGRDSATMTSKQEMERNNFAFAPYGNMDLAAPLTVFSSLVTIESSQMASLDEGLKG
jgi:hypothetical protein